MRKTRNHAHSLLALGVLAVALFAAATAWLLLGWRAIGVTLEDRSGDPGELRGFTLQGVLHWSSGDSSLAFDLHDGYLDTDFYFDFSPWWTITAAIHPGDVDYVVRPQDRDAVNAAAWEESRVDPTYRYIRSTTDVLRRMYTLTLPGDTYLRVAGPDLTLSTPADLMFAIYTKGTNNPLNTQSTDYCAFSAELPEGEVPRSPTAENPVSLEDGWALCWKRQEGDRAPGLYRATGLTTEEISALPADGEAYGQQVLCNSTEFGTLEPFYCPEDAEVALAGASMADGSTLLLYLDESDTVWADLVDEAGRRTDHREVTSLTPDCQDYEAVLLARNTDRDAVLTLHSIPDANYSDKTVSPLLAALRVEDGKFTVVETVADDPRCDTEAAVLNAEGNALLIASKQFFEALSSETGLPALQGLNLRVQPLDGSAATYQGRLTLGGEREWGRMLNVIQHTMERGVSFPTIEKDRG